MYENPTWEANSHSASQETPHIFWKPKVCYHVNNSAQLVPILSQIRLVHTFPPYFLKIHFNIILPSTRRSSEKSLPFRFSDQNFVHISQLSHARYIPCPSHPPWLDHPNNINEVYKLWSSSLCSLLQSPSSVPLS